MIDAMKKSEFFNFGLLPSVCIHSLVEDQYSALYIAREKCDCGCCEWVEGEMEMFKSLVSPEHKFPKKKVHRCSNCNEVRLADYK